MARNVYSHYVQLELSYEGLKPFGLFTRSIAAGYLEPNECAGFDAVDQAKALVLQFYKESFPVGTPLPSIRIVSMNVELTVETKD